LGNRYPQALSGGQILRVAMASSLGRESQLLLLYDTFSNLDGELRRRLSHEVLHRLKQRDTSLNQDKNDQEDAFAVSD
ncbi:iron ABC transporter ATP-binding protein, partial [Pseudomonas syringae pv. tagetis]